MSNLIIKTNVILELENGNRSSQKHENCVLLSATAIKGSCCCQFSIEILRRHSSIAYQGHIIVLEWEISRINGLEKGLKTNLNRV